jgi:hypothetical protein
MGNSEMAAAFSMTDEDMQRYVTVMTQIKLRIDQALAWLEGPPTYPRIEAAAGQIRLVLETVMLSSVITNRGVLERAAAAFKRADHNKAWKLVKKVNPEYWPEPTKQTPEGKGRYRWGPVINGFLREGDYHQTWGIVSEWLHARNPYAELPDPSEAVDELRAIIQSIIRLLEHHSVQLVDRDFVLNCLMHGSEDGLVHVAAFQRLREGSHT